MHATLGGRTVLSARLTLPRSGLWLASIEADADYPMTGMMSLVLGDGVMDLHGAAFGDVVHGRWSARMVGGAGGLGRTIPPKMYLGAPLRLVLEDIMSESGETLSRTVTDRLWLDMVPAYWTRMQGTGAEGLNELCRAAGASWRALPDGTIWAGLDQWPAHQGNVEVIREYPRERRLELACEGIVLPGELLFSRRVSLVEHSIGKDSFRTQVWMED